MSTPAASQRSRNAAPNNSSGLPPVGSSLAVLIATFVVGVGLFAFFLHQHSPLPGWLSLLATLVAVWWLQRSLPGLKERAALREARTEAKRLVVAVRAAAKKQKNWTGTDTRDALETLCQKVLATAGTDDRAALVAASHELDERAEKALTRKPVVREYVEQIGGALLAAGILRAFFYEAYRIPSASMEPTLYIGDHLFVNKFVYGFRVPFSLKKYFIKVPARGDIVVFDRPGDEDGDAIIKRVIGLPGDRVEVNDRHVTVNGKPFETKAVGELSMNKDGDTRETSDNGPFSRYQKFEEQVGTHTHIAIAKLSNDREIREGAWTVEPDHVFVMGDNRDDSLDSRFHPGPPDYGFGQVPLNYIKGRADVIWLSLGGAQGLRFSRMFTLIH